MLVVPLRPKYVKTVNSVSGMSLYSSSARSSNSADASSSRFFKNKAQSSGSWKSENEEPRRKNFEATFGET